jgi:O-antigen ligase
MYNFLFSPFSNFYKDQNIKLDIKFFSSLVFLLPIALITGPAVPDIIISICALYFLIKSFFFKLWKYYQNPFTWIFLVFCGYAIVRSITSEFPSESLTNEGSVFYFRYLFFSLSLWYFLENVKTFSKCLLNIIIICLVVVIIDGMYQYFVGVNFFGNPKFSDDSNRLTGLFGDEPIIGRYVSYLSIFAFYLIYKSYSLSKKTIIYSIALLVIGEVFVFFSGERAPLLYVTLFSLLILIYIPHFRFYRIMGIVISFSIIAIILYFNPSAKERIVDQSISQISETKLPFLPYSEEHESHYIAALKMFQDKPIFGVGTNLFRYQCEKPKYQYKPSSCTSHPHHYYIQILAELGIIGFLFLIFCYFYLSYRALVQLFFQFQSKSSNSISFDKFLIILILLVFWWPVIPHMSFFNNWNSIFLMLPIGFFLKNLYGNEDIFGKS